MRSNRKGRAAGRRVILVAAAALLLGAGPQDVASTVAAEIMSPFCPGVTLHDCPSAEADELRREIVTMAEDGMPAEAIIDALEAEYGPLRASPVDPASRLVPWAVALAGLAGAWLLMRRFASRPPSRATAPLSDDERSRLDAELSAFREDP